MNKEHKKNLNRVLDTLVDNYQMAEWELEKLLKTEKPSTEDIRSAVYLIDNAEETYHLLASFLKQNNALKVRK